MAIRMTGLSSGLDTESIVGALMEAHKLKKTKVDNKKTKLEWKQNIWSSLNTKLYKFYTDFAGKLRFQANYKTKKATSSNANKVTATAGSSAVNGSYTVKVKQMASTQYVTSGELPKTYKTTDKDGKEVEMKVTGTTKLSDIGFNADGTSQITVKSGDKTVTLNVDEKTTINDFVNSLKNAGLNASFDEKQGRFYISSANSGADGAFTITGGSMNTTQKGAMDALKNAIGYDNLSSSQQAEVQKVLSSLQNSTDPDVQTKALESLSKIADSAATSKVTEYYKNQIRDDYLSEYITTNASNGIESVSVAGLEALREAGLDNDTYVDEDRLSIVKDKLIPQKVNEKIKEYQDQITEDVKNGKSEAGVDSKEDRDAALQTAIGAYATEFSGGVAEDNSQLGKLGLGAVDGSKVEEGDDPSGMVVVEAADALVEVNGATLKSSTNKIEVNGLTLDLVDVTGDEKITITVSNDTSAVYDSIKEFINEYNSILAELNKYYYADSARDYDVLTDDQKEDMSDEEIEKWEKKIKDSLLRRDSTLSGILETMRSVMTSTTVTASNGKTYSLANLGITTGKDYKEYGLLHIKGDEDDTDYADDTNVLMNLLNEDPEVVTEVLSGIANKLYTELSKKMQATPLSSALTFYNDKEMNSQLSDYKKDIKKWEQKLKDLEDRYYNQFTAMEKALANMQSQQSALAGLFGGY